MIHLELGCVSEFFREITMIHLQIWTKSWIPQNCIKYRLACSTLLGMYSSSNFCCAISDWQQNCRNRFPFFTFEAEVFGKLISILKIHIGIQIFLECTLHFNIVLNSLFARSTVSIVRVTFWIGRIGCFFKLCFGNAGIAGSIEIHDFG